MFPGRNRARPPRPVDRKLGMCRLLQATGVGEPQNQCPTASVGPLHLTTSICSLAMPRVGDRLRGSLPGEPRRLGEGSGQVSPQHLGVQLCWPQSDGCSGASCMTAPRASVCPCLLGDSESKLRCLLAGYAGKCPSRTTCLWIEGVTCRRVG